jgi:RsmE family RNA methyltransferase
MKPGSSSACVTATFIVMFSNISVHGLSGGIRATFQLKRRPYQSPFYSWTVCQLNRFLFDTDEVSHNLLEAVPTVCLPKDDYRTIHAAKVLGLHNGDQVRSGIVSCSDHDGLMTDDAIIEWLPEGKVKKSEPLGNGDPPGSLLITLQNLIPPSDQMAIPSVSLILALPRPLQLGRILPMISQMGVDRLILTEARKVPKDYFGSHLFRKPELLTEKLVEGLCQSGDVRLPKVHIVRNLSEFLNTELDEIFPLDEVARVIAHPQRNSFLPERRMRDVQFSATKNRKIVIAVGPEGGWEEPNELDQFYHYGFQQITLGPRVLRSDCAVVSLLSLAQDACCI